MLIGSLRQERDELFDELLKKGYRESELLRCCQTDERLTITHYGSIQSKFNDACDAVARAERQEYTKAMVLV